MIPQLLAQIGLPILVKTVSAALQKIDSPATRAAGQALDQVDLQLQSGALSAEDITEANRHIETLAQLQSDELKANLAEVNKSLRAEIASQDLYVRRMRPTFGYVMAVTWAAQMLGVAYVLIFDTSRAGLILNAMSSLSAIWAVGLSVLGIYVYKRSEDKKLKFPENHIFWNN